MLQPLYTANTMRSRPTICGADDSASNNHLEAIFRADTRWAEVKRQTGEAKRIQTAHLSLGRGLGETGEGIKCATLLSTTPVQQTRLSHQNKTSLTAWK